MPCYQLPLSLAQSIVKSMLSLTYNGNIMVYYVAYNGNII